MWRGLLTPVMRQLTTAQQNKFVMPVSGNLPKPIPSIICGHIIESHSVPMLATLFKDNLNLFTDVAVGELFAQIQTCDLQLDDSFYEVVTPITVQYVNCFTRNNAMPLFQIAYTCATKRVTDNKLWNAVLTKLNDEGIYRYLSLRHTAHLLQALVNHGDFIKHPLIGKLQSVCLQQKQYYSNFPELVSIIRETANKLDSQQSLPLLEAFK